MTSKVHHAPVVAKERPSHHSTLIDVHFETCSEPRHQKLRCTLIAGHQRALVGSLSCLETTSATHVSVAALPSDVLALARNDLDPGMKAQLEQKIGFGVSGNTAVDLCTALELSAMTGSAHCPTSNILAIGATCMAGLTRRDISDLSR